jgi:hypothetical protein
MIVFFLNFSVDFDKLGLTDNQNPLGVLPPVLARSMGRAAGSMLGIFMNLIASKSNPFSFFFILRAQNVVGSTEH